MKRFLSIVVGLSLLAILASTFWPEKRYKPYTPSAEYLAQVERFHFPPMPEDWQWKAFEAKDGLKLRWGQTGNRDAAQATIVMVPGYTASLDMYGEHIGDLAARGYHMVGLDLRGQGGSERARPKQPEKLYITDFAEYSDDLASFVQSLNLPTTRPVIIMGMSFGGHAAFRAVLDHPHSADGLFLLAPALRPKAGDMSYEQAGRVMRLGQLLGKDMRYLFGETNWTPTTEDDLRRAGGDLCASNPDRLPLRDVLFTRQPKQRVGGVTYRWGGEFFKSSEYLYHQNYEGHLNLPVTMVHATVDHFVDTNINKTMCAENLSDCISVSPAQSGHCLMQESDAILDEIYQALDGVVARVQAVKG